MAGMVREERLGGLQERLYFARLLWRHLEAAPKAPPGEQLALRSACLLQLYAVPVGILRILAQRARLDEANTMASLAPLLQLLQGAGVQVAAVRLITAALADEQDGLHWLDKEICANWAAPVLAKREPPTQGLDLRQEDTTAALGTTDKHLIESLFARMEQLLHDSQEQLEEW